MIGRAQTDDSAMPAPKKAIVQPTDFPHIREGHNSAKYGETSNSQLRRSSMLTRSFRMSWRTGHDEE
jgi:hypothetical protein